MAPSSRSGTSRQVGVRRYTGVIIALIIAAGVIGIVLIAYSVDRSSRRELEARAVDISIALSSNDIHNLTGSTIDLESSTYRDLKQRLTNILKAEESFKSVYLLRVEDGQVTMLVDSEPEISPNYTPPGRTLETPSQSLLDMPYDRAGFSEGPVGDGNGLWFSGLAPVIDPQSGELVAVVGIDKSADAYYLRVVGFAALPLFLVIPPLLVVLYDRKVQRRERDMMQLKSRFVSVASHELRSPLSGMLWALQSLLKPDVKNLTIEQQVILLDMYQSTEESLATINEILDMSALEKSKPQSATREPVEVGNIIKNAAKTLRLSANERGMKFAFVGNWNGDDCYTLGDKSALKRLFMNLLTNAIKYGRDETTISIRRTQKADMHIIAIEDHGIGIPEAEQRKVVSGYYRASNAQQTQKPGTGIGLLLAKLVTEQHGGKFSINSKEGVGTTVYVSLPMIEPPEKSE